MKRRDVIVVGGGISGLAALHFLRTRKPHVDVRLFEAETRLGGTVGTDVIDGYSLDWGPNGFLDRVPITLQMCEELGLSDSLERANPLVQNRFILRDGELQPVPLHPVKFMGSGILSWPGKLRILKEPFARPRPDGIDETIYEFGKRRIGKEAADYLIQPMVSGVYGGMADRLSLKSCFPIMREMEDQYGSLFRAMIAKSRAAKKTGKKSGGPAGPGGWLTSFGGGLYRVIEQFNELYSDCITTGTPVKSILKDEFGYTVEMESGEAAGARHIVLATPSYVASRIVGPVSTELAQAFDEIPYAPICVICLGYDERQITKSLNGFGFLVPAREGRSILGSIWTSSIFANRAPKGKVQFRTMAGGDGDHESIKFSDSDLLEAVTRDLNDILGVKGPPELVKIYRWTHGIPQFVVGHSDKLSRIEAELARLGNIHITGNAYYGIGLNDCVKQSERVASVIN